MAWQNNVLRVNLTTGTMKVEPLNKVWADQYLGQRGLATKYYVEEVDATVDPLSPENKMIMTTGPLTGTSASTGGRYSVVTKGPLTNAIACSNSGGFFGAELKFAGWDMIIFEGKSPKPVYLYIENDKAELRDATPLWGKSVWETEHWIHATHQDPQIRVATIGVSAEQGCLYSAIVNDLHRAAGRSGVGTVMGSKNLKAVAVRGTKGQGNLFDAQAFAKAVAEGKKVLKENAVTGQGLPTYGTQVLMNVINEMGAMPTRNWRETQFEDAYAISGEKMHEKRESDNKANLTRNGACFSCTIACGRISTIDPTHFTVQGEDRARYRHASGGLEYEAAWALGSDTGIGDLDALTYVNFICNEQGMDPISFGATVAAAMELYHIGAINDEITGGIKLDFGNTEALCQIVELTGKGEGFGREIGLGSKRLCEKYGHPELAMVVKGQEFPAYDARAIQGMGLTYATSNRGACHLRSYTIASEVLGIPFKTDPAATEGKPELVKAFQDATAVVDSAGICVFTTFAWTLADIQPQIAAACGDEWTLDKLNEVGERIWNMERDFNLRSGLTAADDTLPPRLLNEEGNAGQSKGKTVALHEMMPKYYEIRGWTPEGQLTSETRARLSL